MKCFLLLALRCAACLHLMLASLTIYLPTAPPHLYVCVRECWEPQTYIKDKSILIALVIFQFKSSAFTQLPFSLELIIAPITLHIYSLSLILLSTMIEYSILNNTVNIQFNGHNVNSLVMDIVLRHFPLVKCITAGSEFTVCWLVPDHSGTCSTIPIK